MNKINSKILDDMFNDQNIRREITRRSHEFFFVMYLQEYVTHRFAWFHHEMFALTENPDNLFITAMAFRGSGKSTILNLSLILWSILGEPQKKFVVIISQTRDQARMHFDSIKKEFEHNDILKADFGPFQTEGCQWNSYAMTLPKYGAKIICVSADQSIRGLRYGLHRPDLIVLDDVEDIRSVQSDSDREKRYSWFKSEVVLAGSSSTRIILLGNLLHEQSIIMRVREEIWKKKLNGIFVAYPLLDDNGASLWPERFTEDDLQTLEHTVADYDVWRREYLLNMAHITMIASSHEPKGKITSDPESPEPRKVKQSGCTYEISVPLAGFIIRKKYHPGLMITQEDGGFIGNVSDSSDDEMSVDVDEEISQEEDLRNYYAKSHDEEQIPNVHPQSKNLTYSIIPISTVAGIEEYFEWTNEWITPTHCPIEAVGEESKIVELIKCAFGTMEEILKEIGDRGFDPAPLNYLLGLGAQYPEVHEEYKYIASLDSRNIFTYKQGVPYFLCLSHLDHRRNLELANFNRWSSGWWFAVIRR